MKLNTFLQNASDSFSVFLKLAILTLLVGFLSGCPSNGSKISEYDESKGSSYYLNLMEQSSGNEKTSWQLLAIRSLIIENNVNKAESLLNQLPLDLNKQQQIEKLLSEGQIFASKKYAFDINQLNVSDLNDSQKRRYYQVKVALDANKNDVNAQIRDYIEMQKYGTEAQRHQTINQTWNFLTSLDEQAIGSLLVYANESVLQGWVDLIYTYRNNSNVYTVNDGDDAEIIAQKEEDQLNLLKNAVKEWQMQYSNHPAALYLPRTIYGEKYRLPDDTNKKSVALFLPLSGSSKVFGDALYLGYSDAHNYYPREATQNVFVYDTNSASIESLIKQAQQQGAELIVGPLLKQNVQDIIRLSPNIPVLALNKVDENELSNVHPQNICYFALAPEDEAVDAAQHIYAKKKRLPLLIVPNNDLGKRVASSFVEKWYENDPNAQGVYVQYFDSYKSLNKKMNAGEGIELEGELFPRENSMLAFDNSVLSADEPQNVVENNDEPLPFDAIYVFASHDELMLIKAMLEMKSAKMEENDQGEEVAIDKKVPAIFTSSRSHVANTTQDFKYDMDRVQFSDIPMIVNQSNLVEALPEYIKDDYSLVRLYAMGVDAWRLANRYNQLAPYQVDVLNGMTGNLSVGRFCDINRTLMWLQYRKGQDVIVK
ncbi:penicillin-binding protein activator [Orbaceae bacterium ac157xtp]